MATYNLAMGVKKVYWNFDNNSSIKVICPYSPTKNASQFTLSFYSTFGSSLLDLEASYLAVDSSLSSYIYFCSGGNYIAIVAQVGQTWPVNFTTT
jgi:hypothetical protein